jgi:hypothetical protein
MALPKLCTSLLIMHRTIVYITLSFLQLLVWWNSMLMKIWIYRSESNSRIYFICTVDSHCLEFGWVEFLSKSRTSLCINIYNLTPVESNSDESKFRLSRIKVLVPRWILINSHHFSIMAILEELNKLSRFNVFRFELQIFGKN